MNGGQNAPSPTDALPSPNDLARPLLLTMGEPAGIGGEIAISAWLRARRARDPEPGSEYAAVTPFVMLDDPDRLAQQARLLGQSIPIAEVGTAEEGIRAFTHALPVMKVDLPRRVRFGELDPGNGPSVVEAIDRAVTLVQSGEAGAVVTNPIHKACLTQSGFKYSGHTDYLAALAGIDHEPVMMLACRSLRVVPVTIHRPIASIPHELTTEAIVHCGLITAAALRRDFSIGNPRLVVAGLNPHAGESGTIGREDIEIVEPAVAVLKESGIEVSGPLAADSLFHAAARKHYDAAICMYHDQALIPLKTIDFAGGVNITLGLPFVRTSPDHGTALDIAGRGSADPTSLIAALRTAREMADSRARADGGREAADPRSAA